jgi:hypothetical protein
MTARRGFLTTEALIGTAIFGMVFGLLTGMHRLSERHGRDQSVRADGIRSALLAFRTIRADLSRINRLNLATAVDVSADGRSVRLITSRPDRTDLWDLHATPVSYTLQSIRGSATDFTLVRTDERGRRAIPGVVLRNIRFQSVPAETLSTQAPALLVRLELNGSWCPSALMVLQAPTAPAFYDDLGDME